MIHSIYSTKDVFLRELISNASDALDKLRLAAYQDKDLEVDTSDLHISLEIDPDGAHADRPGQRHRDDPRRGGRADRHHRQVRHRRDAGQAREARESGQRRRHTTELIGQFGVGFYSSFMVADEVTLVTRKAGAHAGVRWESTGEGTYTDRRRAATRRRAPRSRCTSSPRTPRTRCTTTPSRAPSADRQALLGLHHLADPDGRTSRPPNRREHRAKTTRHRRRGAETSRSSTPGRRCGRARRAR